MSLDIRRFDQRDPDSPYAASEALGSISAVGPQQRQRARLVLSSFALSLAQTPAEQEEWLRDMLAILGLRTGR